MTLMTDYLHCANDRFWSRVELCDPKNSDCDDLYNILAPFSARFTS